MVSPDVVVVDEVRWSILLHFEVPGDDRGIGPGALVTPPDRLDREPGGCQRCDVPDAVEDRTIGANDVRRITASPPFPAPLA